MTPDEETAIRAAAIILRDAFQRRGHVTEVVLRLTPDGTTVDVAEQLRCGPMCTPPRSFSSFDGQPCAPDVPTPGSGGTNVGEAYQSQPGQMGCCCGGAPLPGVVYAQPQSPCFPPGSFDCHGRG